MAMILFNAIRAFDILKEVLVSLFYGFSDQRFVIDGTCVPLGSILPPIAEEKNEQDTIYLEGPKSAFV